MNPSPLRNRFAAVCACLAGCGGPLVEFPWPVDEATGPTVVATTPRGSASGVAPTTAVAARFDRPMDPATFDAASFTLTQEATPVSGSVTFDAATNTVTLTPTAALTLDRRYTATVTLAVRDTEGRAMAAEYAWSFTCSRFEISEAAAAVSAVLAPDYTLAVSGLTVLTDAHAIVHSATGAAELTAGRVAGQQYVVVEVGGLRTFSELDGAYLSGVPAPLVATLPAAAFSLVGADLATALQRTLILAHVEGGVRSYQAFEITFHPAR